MPFNGAGIFSRTPGTRIANQGALVSAQVNDETDNLVDGVNGKVNLDGLLTYTGLHTLFGDGTALLHQASVRQVQNNVVGHSSAVGGTVDAIQITMSPANTTITTNEKIRWKSGGANTVTAPTLSKDGGATNKTIKKGASAALAVGDLGASGQENEATYNGTDWILTNPTASAAAVPTAASTTEVLTGTDNAKFVTPDANAALWEKGSDIASAGTISVGEGGTFDVTGTTTITDIDPATDKAGRPFRLVHEAAHILTHNAATMINLTGADITTAAGDISTWQSEGSDVVRMIGYERASGAPLVGGGGLTLLDTLATTSGTTATSITIPAGYRYLHIEFEGVSFTGAPLNIELQVSGDDGTNFGTAVAFSPNSVAATDVWRGTILIHGIQSLIQNGASVWGALGVFTNSVTDTGNYDVLSGVEAVTPRTVLKHATGGTSRVNKIRFSGGTFDAGSIAIYGVK